MLFVCVSPGSSSNTAVPPVGQGGGRAPLSAGDQARMREGRPLSARSSPPAAWHDKSDKQRGSPRSFPAWRGTEAQWRQIIKSNNSRKNKKKTQTTKQNARPPVPAPFAPQGAAPRAHFQSLCRICASPQRGAGLRPGTRGVRVTPGDAGATPGLASAALWAGRPPGGGRGSCRNGFHGISYGGVLWVRNGDEPRLGAGGLPSAAGPSGGRRRQRGGNLTCDAFLKRPLHARGLILRE